ncbi:MAG: DNA-binding response regulator [Labilithrix sp.]|nr:DNA-binding response regulator [Labilithrix sp.]MCW5836513.1 DNA-binding response regulator [Labilithrix sp.]
MDDSLAFLVVEDEDVLRRALVRALSNHGRTEGVATCAQARTALRARKYDSLIVDIKLPDGNGLDLVPRARQIWPAIWVLVLTGSIEHASITRAHELGVRYLLKPFAPEHLRVHVEETRARRHAGDRRVSVALDRWTRGHNLTAAETELLALGARGVPREEFAIVRGVRPDTIRKQIQSLLMKTGDVTFEGAVNSLLREAVAEPL